VGVDVDLPGAGSGVRRTADAGPGRQDADPWRAGGRARILEWRALTRRRCAARCSAPGAGGSHEAWSDGGLNIDGTGKDPQDVCATD
jgi:hypothetical protein